MADYIEIDTSALAEDRKTIQSESDRVRMEINRLRDKLVNLGTMWEGPAHNAFMAQFEADYEFMQEFCNELGKYIETMEYAQREYEKCDSQVQQEIASIRI